MNSLLGFTWNVKPYFLQKKKSKKKKKKKKKIKESSAAILFGTLKIKMHIHIHSGDFMVYFRLSIFEDKFYDFSL